MGIFLCFYFRAELVSSHASVEVRSFVIIILQLAIVSVGLGHYLGAGHTATARYIHTYEWRLYSRTTIEHVQHRRLEELVG